ncbi:hypothetical protein AURDEDRAFT_124550 [Auricularia subglabra TFB-10046 SS5]|nr:hypothetical protein AURDEDRAFT_124550 [Auricularia subglabra TFB-10046 SS5]
MHDTKREQQRSQSPSPPDHGREKANHSQSTPHDEQSRLSPTDLARAYSNAVLIERDATGMIEENDRKLEAMLKEIEQMQKRNCHTFQGTGQGGVKVYSDLAVIAHEANALIEQNNGILDMLADKGNDIQERSAAPAARGWYKFLGTVTTAVAPTAKSVSSAQ